MRRDPIDAFDSGPKPLMRHAGLCFVSVVVFVLDKSGASGNISLG
jgi:hypothetical protein